MTMTTATLAARAQNGVVRDGDNPADKPRRRQFSAAYKKAVVEEYDGLSDHGAKGALLRREGLYTSHIAEWRRSLEVGAVSGLAPKHRKKRSDAERELEKARKKIERLEDKLERHRKALEAQGKASELLARLLAESEDDETGQQP
jgi:transposase-like protein